MTIDKHTLNKAKKWADRVKSFDHSQMEGNAPAAAEVILSLPETIVDGDKLREWIESMKVSDKPGGAQALLDYLKRDFLPEPPVEIALGAWAMHPEHGKVMIASAHPDSEGDVKFYWEDGSLENGVDYGWCLATDLSPLPDTQDDSDKGIDFPEELGNGYVAGEHPNPEEGVEGRTHRQDDQKPQLGEVWEVRTKELGVVPSLRMDLHWAVVDDEGYFDILYDDCVTPLRRLVPAQEPRVLVTEQDYREAADDTIVRRPGNANAAYEKWSHDEWRSTVGTNHTDREMAENSGPRTVLWEPK